MLQIRLERQEFFSEADEKFIVVPETIVCMEHSLVCISKWESKWHKPFLNKDAKTPEELMDYFRCMIVRPTPDDKIVGALFDFHLAEIMAYIEDSMTATWFNEKENKKFGREIVTSEVIYYWMTALNIPFECEKWHLNRLLTLVRICNIKNQPPKKMGKKGTMQSNKALNAARRGRMGSKG